MTAPAASLASQSRALWILAVLAVLVFVRYAVELLVPIVIGGLVSLALEPIVAWLERRGLPRLAGTALLMLTLLGGAGIGLYGLRDTIASAVDALPETARRIRETVTERLAGGTLERVSQELRGEPPQRETTGAGQARDQAGAPSTTSGARPAQPASGAGTTSGGPRPGQGPSAPVQAATSALPRIGQSLFAILGHVTVVVFLVFFLLMSGPRNTRCLVEMADSPERRSTIARILRDIVGQLQRFMLVQAFTAAVVALATWGVLAWMGVQNAVLWALLAGLFNTIPYFGPVFVSGGLFAVGAVQEGAGTGLRMALAALAITSLEGWLITPPLMGKVERMNVLTVFVGLLVWTWLWGAWGTLLAVPMLAILKSVADRVDGMKPLGRLMGS